MAHLWMVNNWVYLGLPIKNMVIFHGKLLNDQGVRIIAILGGITINHLSYILLLWATTDG